MGPDPLEEMKPNALFKVKSATIALPKCHPDFNLVAKNVAHFYVGLPVYNGEHPSTPLCSTAVFDFPVSDHGIAAAHEHWIRMQQMTRTRLCF